MAAVKPVLVLYMMSWAVTESVSTQLWLDRACRVNLNLSGKPAALHIALQSHYCSCCVRKSRQTGAQRGREQSASTRQALLSFQHKVSQ